MTGCVMAWIKDFFHDKIEDVFTDEGGVVDDVVDKMHDLVDKIAAGVHEKIDELADDLKEWIDDADKPEPVED